MSRLLDAESERLPLSLPVRLLRWWIPATLQAPTLSRRSPVNLPQQWMMRPPAERSVRAY